MAVGILKKLLGKIIGDLALVREEDLLQSKDVAELVAIDLARGVHGASHLEIALGTVLKRPTVSLLDLVGLAPLPHRIEILQGKSIRIDALVTGVARLALLVLLDLLLERFSVIVLRLESWDTLRRR